MRVDIMMSIPGIEFDEAWEKREVVTLDDLEIPFISRADLIRSKELVQDRKIRSILKNSRKLNNWIIHLAINRATFIPVNPSRWIEGCKNKLPRRKQRGISEYS